MGTILCLKNKQKACLEEDTDGEEKAKKCCNPSNRLFLETQSVHLGFLIDPVLAGVAEASLEAASLCSQGPDEAFPCGEGLREAVENLILIGEGGVDPLPAGGFEGSHYVREDEGIERVVVDEKGVTNIAAKDVDGKLAIEGSTVKQMGN